MTPVAAAAAVACSGENPHTVETRRIQKPVPMVVWTGFVAAVFAWKIKIFFVSLFKANNKVNKKTLTCPCC